MEPNQGNQDTGVTLNNSVPDNEVVFRDSGKSGKGMAIGMVCLAILAAGGIGFGVWAMLDGNQKVAELNQEVADLNTQLSEKSVSATEVETEPPEEAITENTSDYIYVGDWGMKIKIPAELKHVWYSYTLYKDSAPQTGSLSVSGVAGETVPDFADPNVNKDGLGILGRLAKSDEYGENSCPYGEFIFEEDGYIYCYHHPQAVTSINEEDKQLELNSVDLIEKMFKDTNNYSKI